ncbi:MAG: ATP-dependent DNA helicase RecG [Candidatus Pacebacteria bacterium]|nr:ATP-dependent DNA helicase RecG [Candidatus Paceibacterota bacterium]MDD5721870.1 ATP-dependent DNA helicase RecG [Candidatus Paceibacterota bacterium]
MNSVIKFSDSVSKIRGIGPRYLKYLEKLGIKTIKDLLWYFPFRYEDFAKIKKINELEPDIKTSIRGVVKKMDIRRSFRKKMFILEALIEDETGEITAIWFNQPYLKKNIPIGSIVSLSGKITQKGKKFIISSPAYEVISFSTTNKTLPKETLHTGRLVPVYSETQGLSSRALRYFIKPLLKTTISLKEPIPDFLIEKYKLMNLPQALQQIHFPSSLFLAQKAKERFIFESLLLSQIFLLKNKKKNSLLKAPQINLDVPLLQKFVKSLPFTLTDCQKKTIWEIAKNLNQSPMNRLLEGEVGSGKTIVAMSAALLAIKSNYQVALMAPTEILAQQHYNKFKSFLSPFNLKIALLTSSKAKIYDNELEGNISKKALYKVISSPIIDVPVITIGTHALIQKNVRFSRLGLIIVDEQHRFGVEQRKKLISKNDNQKEIPHLLSMTATPIPRTLALAFYGDLDLSVLDELPKERKKIITQIITEKNKNKVYEFIRQEIKKGRQAFVICPRIEETENSDVKAKDLLDLSTKLNYEVKAVKKEHQKLSQDIFPDLKVGMLHGKMLPKEKEKIMQDFIKNKTNILVSTSVIEVGIDIPNASIMIIEGAEHFGLAQLHQFRGRIGRSIHQSYCFIFTETPYQQTAKRLKILEKCHDGFRLAEMDLSLRGPGEFLGTKQSGIPDLVMSSLLNKEFIEKIHQEAKEILKQDFSLKKWPLLLANFQDFSKKTPQQ